MKIPNANRKKALIVVDVQPRFINEKNSYILPKIQMLLERVPYTVYFQALFYAEENSIWDKQINWTLPKANNMYVPDPLGSALAERNAVSVVKTTRSAFKGEPSIFQILNEHSVDEVHIVGVDTDDCITATAHEASDLGFFTYIIEECCQSRRQELHERAVANLRQTKLTNNSCGENIDFIELNVAW